MSKRADHDAAQEAARHLNDANCDPRALKLFVQGLDLSTLHDLLHHIQEERGRRPFPGHFDRDAPACG